MAAGRKPRFCVLKADGTNCEVETAFGLSLAGAKAEIVPMNLLRWGEVRLARFDGLVVPGGFSYGDDVASGKVLAVELLSRLSADLADFASAGKPVLGICNGFQVLIRTGLLPFGEMGRPSAALVTNTSGRYECRWVRLSIEGEAPIVDGLPSHIDLAAAHGEGRFTADEQTLARIESEGLVALRYVDAQDNPTADYPANPNGSEKAIAGVTDPTGRILGLMPHPERFIAPFQHPAWHSGLHADPPHGLSLLRSVVALA